MDSRMLLLICLIALLKSAVAASTNRTSSTVSVNRKPVFRPFKLVKIGSLLKPKVTPRMEATTKESKNKSAVSLWKNPFILVKPLSPWILVSPSKATVTTKTTEATTTTTKKPETKSTINPTLASSCGVICLRSAKTGGYAYPCSAFKRYGKHYLCFACRHRLRVCRALEGGTLIG